MATTTTHGEGRCGCCHAHDLYMKKQASLRESDQQKPHNELVHDLYNLRMEKDRLARKLETVQMKVFKAADKVLTVEHSSRMEEREQALDELWEIIYEQTKEIRINPPRVGTAATPTFR